jgi:signal transduction histidine kinase
MYEMSDNELLEELKRRRPTMFDDISRVEKLENTISELNKKLRESESLKTNFISSVSNEIVNPFASILALCTEIVLLNNKDWEKIKMLISMIYTESFFLNFQFKNIFAAAEIEAGEITLELKDVKSTKFVESIFTFFESETTKRNISIQKERFDDFTFKTDPSKLNIILLNLVGNAIKFSHNNKHVTVKLYQEDNHFVFSIKNEGTSISEDEKKTMFNRFSRNNTKIGSIYRGNGLGLSVVNAMLELLGGALSFESKLSIGTTFVIRIPVCQEFGQNSVDCSDFLIEDGLI